MSRVSSYIKDAWALDGSHRDSFIANPNALGRLPRKSLPYPAVVAIRIDDSTRTVPADITSSDDDWLVTASATFAVVGLGNLSPVKYAALKGVPLTFAQVTDRIGTTNNLSAAHIKLMRLSYGTEFCPHSVTHANPATDAAAITEITASKAALDAVAGAGIECRSFIMPGSWSGAYALDSVSELQGVVSRAIRSLYQCSSGSGQMAYAEHGTGQRNRFFNNVTRVSSSIANATDVQNLVDVISQQGLASTLYMHKPGDAGEISLANFKELIDRIAVARDSGLLYPVTFHTASTCDLMPPVSGGAIWCKLPNSGFETDVIGASAGAWWKGWRTEGTDVNNTIARDTGDKSSGAASCKFVRVEANASLICDMQLQANESYVVKYRAKALTAPKKMGFIAISKPIAGSADSSSQFGEWVHNIVDSAGWATYYQTFAVHKDSHYMYIGFQPETNSTVWIDDVEIMQV
jgi:hypothetical protein